MSKTILIIDDSPTMRQLVRSCLTHGGFQVLEAGDGKEALGKTAGVALAVCDVSMPVMNGIEFVQAMAKRGSRVPILMLTTGARPELMEAARSAGAKGWLVKPFEPGQLLRVVQKLAA
jgi:two-component system, chemotaxis family, chemotaxis protein CheY